MNQTTSELIVPEPQARERLLRLIRRLSLKRGHFVLASGAVSDTYLDLRLTTTHFEGARLSAGFLLAEAARLGANRVGGPTLGADPLVGAAVALSLVFSALALFGSGALGTICPGRSALFAGTRQLLLGLLAAGLTFGLGRLIGVGIS